jgi:subtilisin family serine protease
VRVAVLDSGAALSHPHLAPRIQDAVSFVGRADPEDRNGHGTASCGIVCGPRTPMKGRPGYGIAPNAELYVAKVLDDAHLSGDFDGIMRGVEWALERGCRIVCLPLGDAARPCARYRAFEALAREATQAGALLVGAAGNTSNRFAGMIAPILYPASSKWVLAVASLTGRLGVDLNSNAGGRTAGSAIAVAAPGQAIVSATLGNEFGCSNGTSVAAAGVSGIAALWLEAQPRLSGRELWDVIVKTACALPGESQNDTGAGLVRAPQSGHGTQRGGVRHGD